MVDEQRTLDELDPPAWGAPTHDSYLVRRTHELRRVPLGEFTAEDLRIMIGQQIGLPYLVPRALDVLQVNPLAEGDFYPGDLLQAVLRIDVDYWREHVEQRERVSTLVATLVPIDNDLRAALHAFKSTAQ